MLQQEKKRKKERKTHLQDAYLLLQLQHILPAFVNVLTVQSAKATNKEITQIKIRGRAHNKTLDASCFSHILLHSRRTKEQKKIKWAPQLSMSPVSNHRMLPFESVRAQQHGLTDALLRRDMRRGCRYGHVNETVGMHLDQQHLTFTCPKHTGALNVLAGQPPHIATC